MTPRMREKFRDASFQAGYGEWLKDPITQFFLEELAEMAQPVGLTEPSGKAALYQLGVSVGLSAAVQLLKNAHKICDALERNEAVPPSDFGHREYLKQFGYTDDVLKRIKKESE